MDNNRQNTTYPSPLPLLLKAAAAAEEAANKGGSSLNLAKQQHAPPTVTALAPGFRFHPTDEELVCYYLKRKIFKEPVRFDAIADVDIYKHDPCALSEFSKLKTRDQEWYFYSALDKKYGNGGRMNRATGSGYWKATGKDREIRREDRLFGMKKTLVFHAGRAPDGQRTNWVMHELRFVDVEFQGRGVVLDAYVLCRVFHKSNIGPPSGHRYAPFIEEEWETDQSSVVPGVDEMARVDDVDKSIVVQETPSIYKAPLSPNHESPLHETREFLPIHKPETNEVPDHIEFIPISKTETKEEDNSPAVYLFNTVLIPHNSRKRKNADSSLSNNSDSSARTTTQEIGSSTTTESSAISALMEFSLMEPREAKKRALPVPPPMSQAHLGSVVSPSIMKLITDLQAEAQKNSDEKETLKLDLMSARATISMLQSQLVDARKENEVLKKNGPDL